MRTKKVSRYWCDFCDKAGLQAGAMRKHENHCTMNPVRECRVCALIVDGMDSDELDAVRPLVGLVAMLPDPTPMIEASCGPSFESAEIELARAMSAVMPVFRAAAGNCPACMLAAIRQKKIYASMAIGFNFSNEMKVIFSDINEQRAEERGY